MSTEKSEVHTILMKLVTNNDKKSHEDLKELFRWNDNMVREEFSRIFKDMESEFGKGELILLFSYLEGEFDFDELQERTDDLEYELKYGLKNLEFKGFI